MLSSKARDTFRHVTEPAGQALAKVGVTANSLTAVGLAGSLGAGALIATGQPVVGGAVSLLSGLPDMLDGAVAKASGRDSRRGAFLDSVVDRLSDAAVLAGLIWFAVVRDLAAMAMLAALVLGLSLIVSYIKARAESAQQEKRLAALWSYGDEPVGKDGHQLSAAIYSQEPVDTDGSGARPVRLIFRDHPEWGRSAYLVLEAGDFDCYSGCRLKVTVDGTPHMLPGSRPDTDEAVAMFIDDHKALWKLAKAGKQLAIEFPTKHVGKRTAEFEVGGLNAATLPKWN